MIAINVLGGCNRMERNKPCKQGSLYEMAVTLMKSTEVRDANEDAPKPNLPQLVDEANDLPLQQSMVRRAAQESFMCPFCDAPCSIILDAERHDHFSGGEVNRDPGEDYEEEEHQPLIDSEPSWADHDESVEESDPLSINDEDGDDDLLLDDEEESDGLLLDDEPNSDDDLLL